MIEVKSRVPGKQKKGKNYTKNIKHNIHVKHNNRSEEYGAQKAEKM